MGAISDAIAAAAREAGAEVRTSAPVDAIRVRRGRAIGVVLGNGDELDADAVVSTLDPRLTFLRLVAAGELPAEFLDEVRRYRFRGSSGKVNFALDGLPDSPACARARTCAAPSRSRRALTTWSAPTIRRSTGSSRAALTLTWSSRH
jgi:phytoene dehydrogenase-like protein